MSLLSSLKRVLFAPKVSTRDDLVEFLESRAAFLVQKSITEYAQARANMMFSTLLSEQGFKDAYEAARWAGYPAALSMVAEALAGQLRANGSEASSVTALTHDVIAKLAAHAPTSVNLETAKGTIVADLARAALGPPKIAHEIVKPRAHEIFDALPFHASIREHDYGMFRNTIAFHLTEIMGEMEEMKIDPVLLKN
jgi:hypothetical protein